MNLLIMLNIQKIYEFINNVEYSKVQICYINTINN